MAIIFLKEYNNTDLIEDSSYFLLISNMLLQSQEQWKVQGQASTISYYSFDNMACITL